MQIKIKIMTTLLVENIMVGEFVRLKANSKKTYTKGKFNQATRKYELSNFEDINDTKEVKKETKLFIGFDY